MNGLRRDGFIGEVRKRRDFGASCAIAKLFGFGAGDLALAVLISCAEMASSDSPRARSADARMCCSQAGARFTHASKTALKVCVTFMERRFVDCGKTASPLTDIASVGCPSDHDHPRALSDSSVISPSNTRHGILRASAASRHRRGAFPFEGEPLRQQGRRIIETIGNKRDQIDPSIEPLLADATLSSDQELDQARPASRRWIASAVSVCCDFSAAPSNSVRAVAKLCVEFFRLAPERPKTLEDVLGGRVGRRRLRELNRNRFVERLRVFARDQQFAEAVISASVAERRAFSKSTDNGRSGSIRSNSARDRYSSAAASRVARAAAAWASA